MCISLVLYDSHPALLLLLAFNRDEFWDRPTQPAHFWPDEPCLLAGRDALRKGTWLGVTKHGRFALITNYREPMSADPGKFVQTTTAPSRGALTTNFLTGSMSPLQYLQSLDLPSYCGFNLLVGDLHSRQVAYVSNRDPQGPRQLGPGHYGISNGLLQEWPKVQKCRLALANALELPHPSAAAAAPTQQQQPAPAQPAAAAAAADVGAVSSDPSGPSIPRPASSSAVPQQAAGAPAAAAAAVAPDADSSDVDAVAAAEAAAAADGDLPWPVLFHHVLGDSRQVPPEQAVPLTGVGEHLDRQLSSVFIEPFEMQPGVKYGTRSQTVIAVWRDGRVEQRERYVEKVEDPASGEDDEVMWVWKEQQHEFQLAAPAGSGNGSQANSQQQPQQQQQPGPEGVEEGSEPWHIAKGHLQHSHPAQPSAQEQ